MTDHAHSIKVQFVESNNEFLLGDDSSAAKEPKVVGEIQVKVGTSLQEVLAQTGNDDYSIVAAHVNNQLLGLSYCLYCDSRIEWLDNNSLIGNRIVKSSLAFLLFVACQQLYPEYLLKILHSLRNGRYCELRPKGNQRELGIDDFQAIATRMKEMVDSKLDIVKREVLNQDAVKFFTKIQDYTKAETLLHQNAERISIYTLEGHSQYLYSKLVPNTGYLDKFALEPFDRGFILLETNSKMVSYVGKNDDPEIFAFPRRLQASMQEYATWGERMGVNYIKDVNHAVENSDFYNLVIMAESLQQRAMLRIADSIYEDFPAVKIVLIAGPSSSGKTTFTKRLGIEFRSLGLKPIVISMDNYFLSREDTPLDENGNKDFEGIAAVDLPYFNQQLLEMLEGKQVELPIYDFKLGKRSSRTIPAQLGPDNILLIEGIHCVNEQLTADIPSASKRKIYISCLTQLNIDELTPISSGDNRELRRLVRDLKHRGTSTEKTLNNWKYVRAGEEKNIYPYQEGADFYFNSSLIYEWSVLRPLVEQHLKLVPTSSSAYSEAQRLLKLVQYFLPVNGNQVPIHSLLREFLGGSCFEQ